MVLALPGAVWEGISMDIDYAVGLVNQMIEDDRGRDEGFGEIDHAIGVEWENPKELQALPWIGKRKFPTTAFSDASHAATRAFASRLPKLTIYPVVDDEAEYGQVERLETAMEWEFERLNRIGLQTAHWQVVDSAMKYCAVAIQIEYLPYTFKKRKVVDEDGKETDYDPASSPRYKTLLRRAKYNWLIHHPKTVHARFSRYGMECVAKVVEMTAQGLIDEFGRDNEGVKKLLRDLGDKKDDGKTLGSTKYTFVDLTTWDERVLWASASVGANDVAKGPYVFMNEKHGLPFINWIFVDNRDPVMLPAIKAGLYDNANVLNTIVFSKAVDMAAHPELWISTLDGTLKNVRIDNTNPSQPLITGPGSQVQQLRPPAIDPQLATMQEMAKSDIFRSTVAQVLADVSNIGSTATFSTVNAMLQAAVSQLVLGQNAAERAETLAFYQMFEWIEYSEIPLIAYRKKSKGESKKGQELVIKANYEGENPNILTFDLDYLYLEVKLLSTSITDKQADLNNEVMKVERLGKSRAKAMEDLGEEGYEADFITRGSEDLAMAEIAAEAQRITMQPEVEAQQAAAAQQAAQQQAVEAQKAQADQRGEIFAPQEGMDTRAGGGAGPMGAVPGGTREMMTGQAPSGQGLA